MSVKGYSRAAVSNAAHNKKVHMSHFEGRHPPQAAHEQVFTLSLSDFRATQQTLVVSVGADEGEGGGSPVKSLKAAMDGAMDGGGGGIL